MTPQRVERLLKALLVVAFVAVVVSSKANPSPTPPVEVGADGANGAWMTVGSYDDAVLTINNAGEVSMMECPRPKVQTMGTVTVINCGPVFSKKLATSVLAELRRGKR